VVGFMGFLLRYGVTWFRAAVGYGAVS